MKTTIYMVRHADSPFEFGQERTRGLSPDGFVAAKRVAELLADVDVHHMVSSPYARAKQTIQFLADQKQLEIVEYEELKERQINGLDNRAPWEELHAAICRSFEDKDYAMEGGESTRKAQQRAIPVMESLLQKWQGQTIVVGTHGNIMTIIMNDYDEAFGVAFWDAASMPDVYKLTFVGNTLEAVERIWS